MSGGHFDYYQYHINEIAEQLERNIADIEYGKSVGKVKKQELYLSNIRAIINDEITIDSLESTFISMSQDSIDIESSELEIQFVKEWEEREKYNLTSQAASVAALQELNLFRPTKGEIIRRFDPADGHFGVDIDEIAGENIVSIHDGVVVFSDFSAND